MNSAWPSTVCQAANVGTVDGTYFARVDVFPLTWNPSSGVLSLRTEIDISLEVVDDSIPAPDPILMTDDCWRRRLEYLSRFVVNPEDIESYSICPDISDENTRGQSEFPVVAEYVLLSNQDWERAWQPLIDWNIRRGIYTEFLSFEDIEDGAGVLWGLGRDWAETIRNCMRWYHARGTQYFVLGADSRDYHVPDPETPYDIPARFCKGYWYWEIPDPPVGTESHIVASDWYYACLDPTYNWNTNSNQNIWGEYHPTILDNNDTMDLLPEVYIGRLPVGSSTEARDAACRIVDYQHGLPALAAPNIDLLVVSASVEMPGLPRTWEHLDQIISVVPDAYSITWIAEDSCSYLDKITITPTDVLRNLDGTEENSGAFRTSFGGHGFPHFLAANRDGSTPGQLVVYSDDLRAMTGYDGMLCTGMAFNCLTGLFCSLEDENPDETIGETWLGCEGSQTNAPLGPSYIGNTEQGLNSRIAGGSPTHQLNKWLLDALYNARPSIGSQGVAEPLYMAKATYYAQWMGTYPFPIPGMIEFAPNEFVEPMWDLKQVNLLGDPACPIWLTDPLVISSYYIGSVHCPDDFTISVEDSNQDPLEGVRVCLLLKDANGAFLVYERGYTDEDGEYTVALDPSAGGTMMVTLTKQDYLPDEGEVNLVVQ
jgi:hypothetical protein